MKPIPLMDKTLIVTYKGYRIGYVRESLGYKAAWRPIDRNQWIVGHIYVDELEEVKDLAQECIDFHLEVEKIEKEMGRKLSLNEVSRMRGKND